MYPLTVVYFRTRSLLATICGRKQGLIQKFFSKTQYIFCQWSCDTRPRIYTPLFPACSRWGYCQHSQRAWTSSFKDMAKNKLFPQGQWKDWLILLTPESKQNWIWESLAFLMCPTSARIQPARLCDCHLIRPNVQLGTIPGSMVGRLDRLKDGKSEAPTWQGNPPTNPSGSMSLSSISTMLKLQTSS